MKKSTEEQLKELQQKINKMQMEKKRLQKQQVNEERKKRDHAMILVGTTLLTHYSEEVKLKLINSDDEYIKNWVHSLFKKRETEKNYYSGNAESDNNEGQY